MRTHTRSQIIGLLEQVTGFGLKVGIPVLIAAVIYLFVAALGDNIQNLETLSESNRKYFVDGVHLVMKMMLYACIAVVASIIIRLFMDEVVGQALSLVGALLYFGSPALFAQVVGDSTKAVPLFGEIVRQFQLLGSVCLIPGLAMILRDAIMRIWTGISVKRVVERRWGDEEERRKNHKPKVYGKCWDMPFCRDFVRRVCPAWQAKSPCWRVKVGCYCDERTILQAMANYGTDNEHMRGIMRSLGLDQPRKSQLSNAQKRTRCRRCGIFAEHQRQKYRLLSPVVIPGVVLLMYLFRQPVSQWVYNILETTDNFMRVLAYRGAEYSFAADGRILTLLAMIWLTIIIISYTLRALEYLIFELQI